ncbi:DUF3592 domain-containing protein [Deminuibacter soli]|uniref:DUF3592 domain-containing protein n=1 Tax=Deminuibacter soli TaxID=2291815 RepID=UPI0011C12316|nr:DUF3592 domain-containing protein [Deminuibacter soli]
MTILSQFKFHHTTAFSILILTTAAICNYFVFFAVIYPAYTKLVHSIRTFLYGERVIGRVVGNETEQDADMRTLHKAVIEYQTKSGETHRFATKESSIRKPVISKTVPVAYLLSTPESPIINPIRTIVSTTLATLLILLVMISFSALCISYVVHNS